jgi:hypothetical protein
MVNLSAVVFRVTSDSYYLTHMKTYIILAIFFIPSIAFSQLDLAFVTKLKALDTANILKSDTIAVPNDQLTQKIQLLRKERRGLTTETFLQIKIMEEREKDKIHAASYYDSLLVEVTTGRTGRLIDNCVINLYRRSFTEAKVDELLRFYKTAAGKKMDSEFLLLMLRSIKDAEHLMKMAAQKPSSPARQN